MNQRVQLGELPERLQRKIITAGYRSKRLAIVDRRRCIGWVVGAEDICALRDSDRMRRRLEGQFVRRVSDALERIPMLQQIGPKLTARIQSALKDI